MAFGFSPDRLGITTASDGFDRLGGADWSSFTTTAADDSSGGGASGDASGNNNNQGIGASAADGTTIAIATGGYSPEVAMALEASAATEAAVQKAAAAYADMAREAVMEGRPPADIRFDDPNLSVAARSAIYAEVAQQCGKTTEQIEQQAAAAKQEAMESLQQGVFGLAGAAVAGQGILGALDNITGQAPKGEASPSQAAAPSGLATALAGLNLPKLACADMGSTTAALAHGSFTPMATPGMPARAAEPSMMV